MSRMTDFDVIYGDYKPTTCEWLGGEIDTHEVCKRPALIGKSFCEHHYHRVFRTLTDIEFEEEFEKSEKEDVRNRECEESDTIQEN